MNSNITKIFCSHWSNIQQQAATFSRDSNVKFIVVASVETGLLMTRLTPNNDRPDARSFKYNLVSTFYDVSGHSPRR